MAAGGTGGHDTEAFGRAMQALMLAALIPANFEPFLKKVLAVLSGPGALGRRASLAIVLNGKCGPSASVFRNTPLSDRKKVISGAMKSYGADRSVCFSAGIQAGGKRCGRLLARASARPADHAAAFRLVETAAKIVAARIENENRDADLAFERDISSSVKLIEEIYLSYPGISMEEISRALLDEARRMTGSSLGFAGHTGRDRAELVIPAFSAEAFSAASRPRPLVLNGAKGLWGWVLKRKKPLLANDAQADRRACGTPYGHIRIRKFLGVPAMSGRKLLGMIALANPAGDYSAGDLAAAQKLARVYAMILQRKLAEEKQKEEDTRFRTIINSTKDIIFSADMRGRITYVSPRVEDYGYSQQELLGRGITDFSHPEDREFTVKALANAVKTGRTLPILPYRLRRKDGTYAYVEQKSGIVFKEGRPLYFTGVIRDVTEQRETERLLRESEFLMRMVFDTARDPIFIKDMNGMYVKANKACADLLKTTPEAMIGRSDSDFFPPEAAAEIFRTDSEVVRTGRSVSLNNMHPFPAGGRYVNIVKTPLKSSSGQTLGLLGIARDVTDLKRMEGELALAKAAEAVSSVARPMAHDFNNALAAINGYATLIDDELTAGSPIKPEISRIIEAVKRAAELTSKFQDFARNPKIKSSGEAGEKKGTQN